jgi:DUF971 family protein
VSTATPVDPREPRGQLTTTQIALDAVQPDQPDVKAPAAPSHALEKTMPTPTELNLHQQSRILEITFDDGSHFNLPCEYLRVYSPSAEVQGHGPGQRVLQLGKEDVGVDKIEPVGNYAICLHFDDQHNTGIYSWEYLYKLGVEQERLWKDYLNELEKAGQKRKVRAS